MKFLFAPDSFKGSLSARQAITLLEQAAKKLFPDCETVSLPMADGGEGTMDILVDVKHGRYVELLVKDPLFRDIHSRYAILEGNVALIEMAAASGLPLVPADQRNPKNTTTYGTGQLIRAALDAGCRELVIGVGGSATNDGGIGAMAALGVRFLDAEGRDLSPTGGNLGKIASIDTSGLHPAIAESRFTVMCDIDNPLLGPQGATYVFGPQKGATQKQLESLEAGMTNYAALLNKMYGVNLAVEPGTGAAGGLSAALKVFLGAQLQSGIQTVLELSGFEEKLQGVDLVITGEGRVDGQSARGKVLWGVGTTSAKHGIPAAAIVGGMGPGAESIYDCGISTILPTINGAMDLDEAIERAEELFAGAAERLLRAVQIGLRISGRQYE